MRREQLTRWMGALALLLLAAGPAAAQLQSGNIYARVTDTDGSSLPGVTVTLTGGGAPIVQITGPEGEARFLGLAPGNYRIEAALEGFSTVVYDTVNVRVGQNTTIQLQMSAAVEEVITVTAESPLLDERKISTGATLSQAELEKVPTSRDPWAILGTTPGVQTDRINVGGNESGQQSQYVGPGSSGDDATWAVDGVVITDMGAIGSSPTYYNFDAFEEMQVSTGGSDASLATGGVALNMVTKRGTNEWRGSGRYITATDSWQSDLSIDESELGAAGPWNNGNAQEAFAQGNRIVDIVDWGVELGGPVVQDRVWIWANYGKQDVDLLTIADVADNTELDTYGAKLNAQVTPNNSLVGFYNYGDKVKSGRNAGPTRPQPTTWNQTGPSDIYKLEDTHIFGNNFFLTGLVSYVGGGFQLTPQGGLDGPNSVLVDGVNWAENFLHHETDRPQEQARLDGSYFFTTGTLNHELKFGAGYREVELYSYSVWPGYVLQLPFIATAQVARPKINDLETQYTSAYLQDTLSIGNLTANVGLRYDLQGGDINPVTTPGVPGFETLPDGTPLLPDATSPGGDIGFEWETITPRLGLTYALGEERDTLLRASYSRFATQLAQGFATQVAPAATYSYTYFYDYQDTNGDGRISRDEINDITNFGTNGYDPLLQSSNNRVDPDFDAPLTDELLVGVEHALLPEFVIGAHLTYRQLTDLAEQERLVIDGGTLRPHQRSDYELISTTDVTLPNGETSQVSRYGFREGIEDAGGWYLTNGDREQEYLGGSLTFNKRLSNRWMMRGNFTLSDWTWKVPDSENEDPNQYLAGQIPSAQDGDPVLQGSGTGSGSKGDIFINSNWSYDLTGLYQIAPDTPWGFNVSAHLYGREGYPIPFWINAGNTFVCNNVACTTSQLPLAASASDEFRNPDVHLVDLRLEKEFSFDQFNFTVLGEVFNALNESYVLQRETRLQISTGAYVNEIVSPRVFRLGARFSFR